MADATDPAPAPASAINWAAARARLAEIAERLERGVSETDILEKMALRAQALAAPEHAAGASATRDLIVFSHGTEQYGLEVSSATAVVPVTEAVPLPETGAIHMGLLVHRGALFALVSLNALLDRPTSPSAAPAFAILLDDADCAIGLAADAVLGVRRVAQDPIAAGARPSIVTALLDDGTSVLSAEAIARNARLIVDHRLRGSSSE